MHPMPVLHLRLAILSACLIISASGPQEIKSGDTLSTFTSIDPPPLPVCNCSITQDGFTYPISSLSGTESAVAFYDYGNPNGSSANTGLELNNALILFLYEDVNTGIIML
jgi:hypothetical protein